MIHKRVRVIRIRISEEEFRVLSEVCERSAIDLSDLALLTMNEMIKPLDFNNSKSLTGPLWVAELLSRLTSVQAEVERLERLLNVNRTKA